MKEIIALHQQILALPDDIRPQEGIDFSRDDAGEEIEWLPAELRAELDAARQAINETLPEDFDYFVFAGRPDAEPVFTLEHARMPAAGSEDGTFQPERSLAEQLREVNWEQEREKAGQLAQTMDGILHLTEQMSAPLRPAKAVQREFREEAKEFTKEKRVDTARIHVLYWHEERELMEADFADGAALRDALPRLVAQAAEIITVVAWGKPLPAERIDALKSEAQKALRERVAADIKAAEQERLESEQEGSPGSPPLDLSPSDEAK